MGISWSPLSGLKGVKPPVEFEKRIRYSSPGHAGKEGPHLAMTGAYGEFSQAAASVWGFSPSPDACASQRLDKGATIHTESYNSYSILSPDMGHTFYRRHLSLSSEPPCQLTIISFIYRSKTETRRQ